MKKFIIALATALILSVPAFADADPSFASDVYYGFSSDSTSTFHLYTAADVYFYSKLTGSTTYIYAISETRGSVYYQSMTNSTPSEFSTSTTFGDYYNNLVTYNANIYFGTPISVFPSGTSDADIQSAFAEFLDAQNVPAVPSSFTVPSGNVLYFQVVSEQDVDFDANMPRLSSPIFSSQYGPWGNTGIKFGPAASLPTSGTTFPILSQDNIRWFVQAPTNVFGQSKIGTMQKHCIVGQWYALYCPDVFGLNETSADLDSSSTVPGASVKVSGSFAQIKVYPLTSTFDFSDGEFVTSSNDDYNSYFDGFIDENGTVTFTDQNGDVNSPVSGGQNFQDYETDPFALVENIKSILSNILSEIKSLFTFGYDAIQSLVNIMSDFVNVFQQLYTWLPSEVYTALVSAIIVAITIGVFKVFL